MGGGLLEVKRAAANHESLIIHMESSFLFQAIAIALLLLSPSRSTKTRAEEIKSMSFLDLLIRDAVFDSYKKHYFRTGQLRQVNLPKNLSDIRVDVVRYRCGSLSRYGAHIKEFRLGVGITVQPCAERVLVVRQVLGFNWSSMFYSNYDLSGYQLVSPILGLLAYNGGTDINVPGTVPLQLGLVAGENPILVNFTRSIQTHPNPAMVPFCANFQPDRKLVISSPVAALVCPVQGHGHFGLLTELPAVQNRKKESWWKVVVGSSIGAVLGVFLLSLLMVAVLVKAKNKSKREEMERRAYEEEALQVSMVGHVRAPTASATRTTPVIEYSYGPFYH